MINKIIGFAIKRMLMISPNANFIIQINQVDNTGFLIKEFVKCSSIKVFLGEFFKAHQ